MTERMSMMVVRGRRKAEVQEQKAAQGNQVAALMPRSASLSFSIRGWLASGIKVEGLTVNTKTSKGTWGGSHAVQGCQISYH